MLNGNSVGSLFYLRFSIEHAESHPEIDDLILKRSDGRTNCLKRFIYTGDIRHDDEQLANRKPPLQGTIGAEAKDHCGAKSGRQIYSHREQRLTQSDLDAGISGTFALCPESLILIGLAAKGDDYSEHRHRLMDNRERLAFHCLDLEEATLNVLDVIAHGVVKKRHYEQRDKGQTVIHPIRNPEHSNQCDKTLSQGRNGHSYPRDRVRHAVDNVNQHARSALVVKGKG